MVFKRDANYQNIKDSGLALFLSTIFESRNGEVVACLSVHVAFARNERKEKLLRLGLALKGGQTAARH